LPGKVGVGGGDDENFGSQKFFFSMARMEMKLRYLKIGMG